MAALDNRAIIVARIVVALCVIDASAYTSEWLEWTASSWLAGHCSPIIDGDPMAIRWRGVERGVVRWLGMITSDGRCHARDRGVSTVCLVGLDGRR
jgi:hypothetical protein